MTARALLPCALLLALAAPAAAGPRPEWSLAVASGTTRFDQHLADYRWDLAARPAWGVQAGARAGRFGLALRTWTAASMQALDAAASVAEARVRVTTFDLLGEAEAARVLGTTLLARASAGRTAIGYAPDRVTIDAGSGPVPVDLAPVHAWTWSAGAALRRGVAANWTAALALERQSFAFETAHRSGASVTLAREAFGNWNGRLELARTFGTR